MLVLGLGTSNYASLCNPWRRDIKFKIAFNCNLGFSHKLKIRAQYALLTFLFLFYFISNNFLLISAKMTLKYTGLCFVNIIEFHFSLFSCCYCAFTLWWANRYFICIILVDTPLEKNGGPGGIKSKCRTCKLICFT